jgi:hypothetical protein
MLYAGAKVARGLTIIRILFKSILMSRILAI